MSCGFDTTCTTRGTTLGSVVSSGETEYQNELIELALQVKISSLIESDI